MSKQFPCVALVAALAILCLQAAVFSEDGGARENEGMTAAFRWVGKASHIVVVRVPPMGLERRSGGIDESPASIHLDFGKLFSFQNPPDLSTLQVIRFDPKTGRPIAYKKGFRGRLSRFDLPFRFDFDDLRGLEVYPWYNVPGRSTAGNLVWTHVQQGDEPSYYAIYVDPCRTGKNSKAPRRPQIGDGDALYRQKDVPLAGTLQVAPCPIGWRKSGRPDVLIGTLQGCLLTYENRGKFKFGPPDFVYADGKPVFVGYGCCPKPVCADWDGDGDLDLIVGAEPGGRVLLYENVAGTGREPSFVARGEICDRDGKPVRTPPNPCKELPVFNQDYSPYPEVVDWNGDGKVDLLLGGYLTGQIFFYKNVSSDKPGPPVLELQEPLQSDGKTIDVGWIASPTTVDFRDAGVRDLVCGSMKVRENGGMEPAAPALHYFKNTGTKAYLRLEEIPFPLEGSDWRGLTGLAVPRSVDWDGDGKTDLLVGVCNLDFGGAVIALKNIGTKEKPLFRKQNVLMGNWEHYPTSICLSSVDLEGNGRTSLVSAGDGAIALLRNVNAGNPPVISNRQPLRKLDGGDIVHKSETGDDFATAIMYDWRRNGAFDLLVGDAQGCVWYYENVGDNRAPLFKKGEKLLLESGEPVMVRCAERDGDIQTHNGNRATVAAGDMDADGASDLVVGDALGSVTYFHNIGTNKRPQFANGETILKLAGRVFVSIVDWNKDGLPDILASPEDGIKVFLNEGTRSNPKFGSRIDVPMPFWIPYPCAFAADWNGDGDEDILATGSYGYLFFFERSFVDHGYASAVLIKGQTRNR